MSEAKSRVTASTQGRVSRIMEKVRHDKYNEKCVCEICTCGIHRCPTKERRRFEGRTTNQEHYQAYRIEPEASEGAVYRVQPRHYDAEALKTTYRVQYTPKKAPLPAGEVAHSVQYRPQNTPFYSETEYNSKYLRPPAATGRPQPAYQYRPNRAKFEGVTSYNSEFTPKPLERQVQNPELGYSRKSLPFTGESSYKEQYKRYNIAPQKQEEYAYRPNTAKFAGESRYKQDFHSYPKGTYEDAQQKCPIYELPKYPAECSPGKRHLNYSAEKDYWD